jgi:hypothetical protein
MSKRVEKSELVEWWLAAMGEYAQRGYHEDQRVHEQMWWGGRQHAAVYAAGYSKKSGVKAYQDVAPVFFEERWDARGRVHYGGPCQGPDGSTGRMWSLVGCRVDVETHGNVEASVVRCIRRFTQADQRSWRRPRRFRDRGSVGFRAYNAGAVARSLLRGRTNSTEGPGGRSHCSGRTAHRTAGRSAQRPGRASAVGGRDP